MAASRDSWHWQESGTAWKGVGIYHITITIPTRAPLLGELIIPNNEAERAWVKRSTLGEKVVECLFTIPNFHPEIRILQFCLMPDHLHAVLHVTCVMPIGIKAAIRGFWQAIKQIGREYSSQSLLVSPNVIRDNRRSSEDTIRPNGRTNTINDIRDNSPLFTEKPFVRVMSRSGQLQTMIRYVQLNPIRLATKRLHPGYFHVMHNVEVAGRTFDAVGNVAILLNPQRATVHVHKEWVWDAERHSNPQPLQDYKNACVLQARQGVTMVSPFISPHEQEVERVLVQEQHPIIVLMDNGFRQYYKPTDLLFDACAEGRVLFLAPAQREDSKKVILRSECMQLNGIADEIANEGTGEA